MRGVLGDILSPQELIRLFKKETPAPTPLFQRLPAYTATSYKQAVQAAERKIGTTYKPENSMGFKIDTGKNTSDFNFGQTNASASASVTYAPWFSFTASASHSSESRTVETGSESESVNVTITYDTFQIIPITLGSWNIDISAYKLRSDAPKEIQTLARISSLVIATGLGYEITVGANTASDIDSRFRQTTSASGSLSIFGIPINLSGDGSTTDERNSHTATWDNASKTFKVIPAPETGFATVVGVIGEKFDIL